MFQLFFAGTFISALLMACQPKKKNDAQLNYAVGDWWSDPGSNLLTAIAHGRSISTCLSAVGSKDQQKFLNDAVRFEKTVRSALQEWIAPLKVTPKIERTFPPCRSDLQQGHLQVSLHYDEAYFQSQISQTTSPTLGVFLVGDGGLHLNVAGVLNPGRDATGGYKTTLHELGHALGLTHSSVPGAVMQAYLSRASSRLTSDDIAGIQAVWSRISKSQGSVASGIEPNRRPGPDESSPPESKQSERARVLSNTNQQAAPAQLALRYDSWFKVSQAQSYALSESEKCALKVDQRLKVQILDSGIQHAGHIRVRLMEELPQCAIGRSGAVGFLYRQHLDL